MHQWEAVLYSVANESSDLGEVLSSCLDELNVSVPELCRDSELSESTLYKILSGDRQNIELRNFQLIIKAIKRQEHGRDIGERTVAVITNRESLERVRDEITVEEYDISLERYPCSTVEEAMRQGIVAERDGVDAIICGPITAYTLENIVHVPVIGLDVRSEQILQAVETVVRRTDKR